MFLVALCLSAVAAFYSIVGLTAIFAAAVMPIILMGSILEIAKLTVTVWLHEYWDRARWLMKVYLCSAVVVLMVITSMGIFGFLSKAHSDQSMVSGDILAKISIYDEKIRTAKDNIDANRKALKQMDEAVDQVMGRSTDEKGADKAVSLRRGQQKERGRLLAEIEAEQKKITAFNEERAPIAAEVRKVEAEVGPIKYIAALIYGDNPDGNLLERAVRWVIIMLVIVFDPLAVMMLLAATESRKWLREDRTKTLYEPDDGPLTEEQIAQLKEIAQGNEKVQQDPHPPGWMFGEVPRPYPMGDEEVEEVIQEFDRSKHAYLDKPFVHFENLQPMVSPAQSEVSANDMETHLYDDESHLDSLEIKLAKSKWKELNPNDTLKNQRHLLELGVITKLPWMDLVEPQTHQTSFGKDFPDMPQRGDLFINTETLPTHVFKYNGEKWIEIDKIASDSYVHDDAYIDYLISRVSSGEYDPELLTDAERIQIELRLHKDLT